eukprot:jgi/Mesvir1/1359/Mv12280-RA.2
MESPQCHRPSPALKSDVRFSEMTYKLTLLKNLLNEQRGKVTLLEEQVEDVKKAKAAAEAQWAKDLASKCSENRQLREECESRSAEMHALRTSVQPLQDKLDASLQNSAISLLTARSELEKTKASELSLRMQLRTKEVELSSTRNELSAQAQRVNSLVEKLGQLESLLQGTKEEMARKEKLVGALPARIEEINKRADAVLAQNEALQVSMAALRGDKARLQEAAVEAQMEVERCKKAAQMHATEAQALRDMLALKEDVIVETRQEAAQLREKKREAQALLADTSAAVMQLESALAEARAAQEEHKGRANSETSERRPAGCRSVRGWRPRTCAQGTSCSSSRVRPPAPPLQPSHREPAASLCWDNRWMPARRQVQMACHAESQGRSRA